MTNLYTFIMEYLGGSYISQYESINKEQAMILWIQNLEIDQIKGFTPEDKEKIIKEGFEEEDPSNLRGIHNTWHFIVRTKKGVGFVNFVCTVK